MIVEDKSQHPPYIVKYEIDEDGRLVRIVSVKMEYNYWDVEEYYE